ncbi:MAG: hypothetical protein WCW66_03960 [Patescibacteria group bacterium]
MPTKHDHLIIHPHTNLPETHTAPVKRSAKIIAMGFLLALALLAIYAGFIYISYLMSPRGEYSFPL